MDLIKFFQKNLQPRYFTSWKEKHHFSVQKRTLLSAPKSVRRLVIWPIFRLCFLFLTFLFTWYYFSVLWFTFSVFTLRRMCQNTGYILVYSLYGNIRFRGNPYSGKFYAFPVGIYLFNVNSGNTRRICVTCSKLTLETAEQRRCRRFWYLYCQLWKYFRHCFRVFIVDFEQVNAGWGTMLQNSSHTRFFYYLENHCNKSWIHYECHSYVWYLCFVLSINPSYVIY